MSWINSPNGRSILVLAAVMLTSVALAVGMQVSGLHPAFPVRLAIGLVIVVAGIWAACRYWRNVDEAGREAQKWAWFWGGSIGMAAGMILLALAAVGRIDVVPADTAPRMLLFYGAGVMIVAQLAGFLAAWIYWWARRR